MVRAPGNDAPVMRRLSYTEVSTALDCWARWDFGYGDRLAGSSLKAKAVAPILSAGRAWGAAAASYHAGTLLPIDAIDDSLEADADRQREFGVHDQAQHDELRSLLVHAFAHYRDTTDYVPVRQLEHEIVVPIPSRTGKQRSSKYRLLCRLDAVHDDADGRTWLWEYKWRGQLTDVRLIALSRQIRWYAWAYREATGREPYGVWVDERLADAPKYPRMVKGRKKGDAHVPSHAKDQLCTPDAYTAICDAYGVEADPDTVRALSERRWAQRVPVQFRRGELDEAGEELVSAARLIADLDHGHLYPLRNAKRANCNGCRFRDICDAPDNGLVDDLFERRPPKRDRRSEDE